MEIIIYAIVTGIVLPSIVFGIYKLGYNDAVEDLEQKK